MQSFDIMRLVYVLIPMILALSVHEFFHAWTALKLGDDTAARQGRLTLNPGRFIRNSRPPTLRLRWSARWASRRPRAAGPG